MNVLLQRHCAKHIYILPDGLKELMSDISREVLRCNPTNIYSFIADYLDALIITRENARVAARLVQSIMEITTTTCDFLKNTGIPRKEADSIVEVIQRTFKKYLRDCPVVYGPEDEVVEIEEANIVSTIIDTAQVPIEIGEEAARIIQHAYRNFKQRREKEKELLCGVIDWRVAARSAIRLYRRLNVTNEEASRAATLIKAAYKGYYTRRAMKQLASRGTPIEDDDQEGAFEEETKSITAKSEKSVKINYSSVVPHVDFDEYRLDQYHELGDSSTMAVVANAVDSVFEKTMDLLEQKTKHGTNYGTNENLNDDLNQDHSEEVIESFDITHEPFEEIPSATSALDDLEFDFDTNEEQDDNNNY